MTTKTDAIREFAARLLSGAAWPNGESQMRAEAAALIYSLMDELDEACRAVEWRPIETAPLCKNVLVCFCDDHECGAHVTEAALYYDDEGELYWSTFGGDNAHGPESRHCPQWWMPKPKPKLECSDARNRMLAGRLGGCA